MAQGELSKDVSQLLGHFNRVMHKFMQVFKSLEESRVAESLPAVARPADSDMLPVPESITSELVRMVSRMVSWQFLGHCEVLCAVGVLGVRCSGD